MNSVGPRLLNVAHSVAAPTETNWM